VARDEGCLRMKSDQAILEEDIETELHDIEQPKSDAQVVTLPEPPLTRRRGALSRAACKRYDELICSLPSGDETVAGERGSSERRPEAGERSQGLCSGSRQCCCWTRQQAPWMQPASTKCRLRLTLPCARSNRSPHRSSPVYRRAMLTESCVLHRGVCRRRRNA